MLMSAPPQHAVCGVCLLSPAPACGPPTPPCVGPLDASVPRMVKLGVAEAGKFGFVFSSPAG